MWLACALAVLSTGAHAQTDTTTCTITYCIGRKHLSDSDCGCSDQGKPAWFLFHSRTSRHRRVHTCTQGRALWGVTIAVCIIALIIDFAFWRSLKRKKYGMNANTILMFSHMFYRTILTAIGLF